MSYLAKLTLGLVLLAFVCSIVAVRASADGSACSRTNPQCCRPTAAHRPPCNK
jgi:hypothetical protein